MIMSKLSINTYVSLTYELKKKLERYLRVNLLGPGPRLIKKNLPGRGLTKVEKHCSIQRRKFTSTTSLPQSIKGLINGLEGPSLNTCRCKKFSLLQNVHTDSAAYTAHTIRYRGS